MGLILLEGKFARFHGWIRYDPGNTGACQVMLDNEAGSLTMASETIRDRSTEPGMMDLAATMTGVDQGIMGPALTGEPAFRIRITVPDPAGGAHT